MLVKTMLDCGAKAQIRFGCDVNDPANKNLTDSDASSPYYYAPAQVTAASIGDTGADDLSMADLSFCGLRYTGSTIVYLSETSIRHYFKVTDAALYASYAGSVTFGSDAPAAYTRKGKEIYFEKKNVSTADLDTLWALTIGGNDYRYSVLAYVKACLASDKTTEIMKALAAATYLYQQAAKVYFA